MELRVHGIGVHDASGILGRPTTEHEGARTARFGPAVPVRPIAQAFVWSQTTRAGRRSFRFLLLPFALVNVAGFMHTPGRNDGVRGSWDYQLMVQMVGISVTISYWFWMLGLLADLPRIYGRHVSSVPATIGFVGASGVIFLPIIARVIRGRRKLLATPTLWNSQTGFWGQDVSRGTAALHLLGCLVGVIVVTALRQLGADKLTTLFLLQVITLILLGVRWTWPAGRIRPESGGLVALALAVALPHLCFGATIILLGTIADLRNIPAPAQPPTTMILSREPHWQLLPAVVSLTVLCGVVLARRQLSSLSLSVSEVAEAAVRYGVAPDVSSPVWFAKVCDLRTKRLIRGFPGNLLPNPLIVAISVVVLVVFCWAAYFAAEGFLARLAPRLTLNIDIIRGFTVLLMLITGVVLFALFAYREARAKVATIYDIIGYWPRRYHPLAPRSYADEASLDLAANIAQIVGRGLPLTIIGHSQGSVLSFAALRRVDPTLRAEVKLVTCGSPLRSLYAAGFPAYFSDAAFATLRGELKSWQNVYRDTDPIATAVFPPDTATADFEIIEPHPDNAILDHSGYWDDPQLRALLDAFPEKLSSSSE
jgi:hypothetical protein